MEKKHMKPVINHRGLVITAARLNTKACFQKQKNKFTPVFHKAMCHQCLMNTTKFCKCLTKFWDTLSVPSTFDKFSMKQRSVHTVHTYQQHRALEFLVKLEGAALPL